MSWGNEFLRSIPFWSFPFLIILVLLLSFEAGMKMGKLKQKRLPDKAEEGVSGMVGAALALLGFLMAFITGIALGTFNERRLLIITEANVIGSAYNMAGLVDEPYRSQARQLLREYTDLRLEALDPTQLPRVIDRSEQIHEELWRQAEQAAREDPNPPVTLYLSAVNNLIDVHTQRIDSELDFGVPPNLLFALFGVSILTMVLVGLRDSYEQTHNRLAIWIVLLILTLVFVIIIDLDLSHRGLIKVSWQSLIALQANLQALP